MTRDTAKRVAIWGFVVAAAAVLSWEVVTATLLPGMPTLSRLLLDADRDTPWHALSLVLVFALGVLVGHLWLPQYREKLP